MCDSCLILAVSLHPTPLFFQKCKVYKVKCLRPWVPWLLSNQTISTWPLSVFLFTLTVQQVKGWPFQISNPLPLPSNGWANLISAICPARCRWTLFYQQMKATLLISSSGPVTLSTMVRLFFNTLCILFSESLAPKKEPLPHWNILWNFYSCVCVML